MKIALIGVGTASAVAASTLLTYLPKDVEVTCFYDPNIPITHVGESTSAAIYGLIYDAAKFDPLTDLEEIDGTLRFCTKFFWQKAHGEDFTVRYAAPGLHVNSEKFSWFIFKRLEKFHSNFKMVATNVTGLSKDNTDSVTVQTASGNYAVDYVVDCRGTPSVAELDSNSYSAPEFVSVNSVMLYPEFKRYDESYTSSYVHNNGWMFGVPLQHRKAWGYLYNNTVTSQEDAARDFAEIKGIDTDPLRKFSWRPYYKNLALEDRIMAMGNRLYFFEPHQAIPLHFYLLLTKQFCELLANRPDYWFAEQMINRFYATCIDYIQDLIAINYVGRMDIDSEFWRYAKTGATSRLHNSNEFQQYIKTVQTNGFAGYALHGRELMREYIEGYKIVLPDLSVDKP